MSDENTSTEQGTKRKVSTVTKTLPTDRIAFDKQLQIARAFAALYASTQQAVTNEQVGAQLSPAMKGSTVGQTNAFFVDVGLISRDGGSFIPHPGLLKYNEISAWDETEAKKHIAEIFEPTWFHKLLAPRLQLNAQSISACLGALASECGATQEQEDKLKLLPQFLQAAGLVRIDGDTVYFARQSKPKPQGQDHGHHDEQQHARNPSGNVDFSLPLPGGKMVRINAPFDLTPSEIGRIKQWIDVTLNSQWSAEKT